MTRGLEEAVAGGGGEESCPFVGSVGSEEGRGGGEEVEAREK